MVNNMRQEKSLRYYELKESIKDMMHKKAEPYSKLKIIDTMQRFGISYHFEEEINGVLSSISMENTNHRHMDDLPFAALRFRLLRENCFPTTQETLGCHNYESICIKMTLQKDVDGLISLYEASCLGYEGEEILDAARTFSTSALKELMPSMMPRVRKSLALDLELPLHWRAPRLETRWSVDHNVSNISICRLLLQFAKLNFNMVQDVHQQELATVTRWWRHTALSDNLTFARDRLMECFYYATGIVWEPDTGACREMLAKVSCLILHLDDVYDAYGTMDELVLFTDAIGRWDANPNEALPEYMRALYFVIYNTSNEVADHALKEHGCSMRYHLQKVWHDISITFLVEAKWQYGNHRPSLQEYLENGWVSSSAPLLLLHAVPMLNSAVNLKTIAEIQNCPRLVQSASLVLRLCNDFATHSAELQRGDAPSSIAIHMAENGVNENDSRKAMQDIILKSWKIINKEAFNNCQFSRPFTKACVNLARISHCIYHGGDGFGAPSNMKRKQIKDLFLEPFDETND
ncbi:hypothetical protein EJB05_56435, partial [Eragrostis curvula]